MGRKSNLTGNSYKRKMGTCDSEKSGGVSDGEVEYMTPTKRVCGSNQEDLLDDSLSYVAAVMSGAHAVTVEADIHQEESTVSQMLRSSPVHTGSSSGSDKTEQIVSMISKLSSDVHKLFNDVNARIDTMASDIESKLSTKLAQMLDKRICTEISKVKKSLDIEIGEIKSEVREDMKALQEQVQQIDSVAARKECDDVKLNLVIRNLPETDGERLDNKVSSLLKDGLKLRDVGFSKVERKEKRRPGKHGVVIMTCRSLEDRDIVLRSKKRLTDSRNFRQVFIHADQTYQERLQASNFRTLIAALNSDTSDLHLKGNRLVRSRNDDVRDRHHVTRHGETRDRSRNSDDSGRRSADSDVRSQPRYSGNNYRRVGGRQGPR